MKQPRRTRPPLWLWILWIALGLGLARLWFVDLGDEGMRNVGTFLLCALGLLLGFLWFVLLSGHSPRRRATVALGTLVGMGLVLLLVRVKGFGGSMIPELTWRFATPAPAPVPEPVEGENTGLRVDLTRTSLDDFPGFLGRERDNRVAHVDLDPDWTGHPPQRLWRREIGAGWSGFAVVNGTAVTMEQWADQEVVSAYRALDGQLLWTSARPGGFDHFLGGPGPRSTPTLHRGDVFSLGARGRLARLDGSDGSVRWERDLLADYDVTTEMEAANVAYGRSNSPLLVGDLVIVPAGGDASTRRAGLAAFDAGTGELVWESVPRQISFSSPRVATLADVEQILIVNEDTASGHALDSGALLWEHEWPGRTPENASVSQAVPVPPDRVLLSKGYGGGSLLLELVPRGDGTFEARPVWRNRRALRTKFTNVVLRDGHAYGLSDGILECVALATGERLWKEGRYGHGQVLLVGAHLLVLSEEGRLVLLAPGPGGHGPVLGEVDALEGKTWNHLALHGDVLLLRNGSEATAFRLKLASD